MNVIFFEIPSLGLKIRAFGVMAMLAFIVGMALVIWRSRKTRFPAPFLMDLGIICLLSGMVGARLFFVIENHEYYNWSLFHVGDLGFGVAGAILGLVLPFTLYFGWKSLHELEPGPQDGSEADEREGNAASNGTSNRTFYVLIILSVISAVVLSRVIYVYQHPEQYIQAAQPGPFDFLKLWKGGIVFYGGLFGGMLGGIGFIKWKGDSVLKLADLFAPPLLLAQAIARWGCFFAGDDFGRRVSEEFPLAIRFPKQEGVQSAIYNFQVHHNIIERGAEYTTWVHPAQLYMSAGVFICFLLLLGIEYVSSRTSERKLPFHGWSFGWMLGLYGIHRFIVEFFRGDPVAVFTFSPIPSLMKSLGLPKVRVGIQNPQYGLRISQLISVFLVVGAILLLCWCALRGQQETSKSSASTETTKDQDTEDEQEKEGDEDGQTEGNDHDRDQEQYRNQEES